MNANDKNRIQNLLRQALKPVEGEPEPSRDLWPAVLRRLDAHPAAQTSQSWLGWVRLDWVWLDWALLAGLAVVTVAFPTSIPLLLYYL